VEEWNRSIGVAHHVGQRRTLVAARALRVVPEQASAAPDRGLIQAALRRPSGDCRLS
jgi:hypothetical protein